MEENGGELFLFFGWHYIRGTGKNMAIERCMKFHGCMKGTSPAVLQGLVHDSGRSRSKYTINTHPSIPVLLISNHPDFNKHNKMEVEEEKAAATRDKKLAQYTFLCEIWAKVVCKMKEGPHSQARHQHIQAGHAQAMDSNMDVPVTNGTDNKVDTICFETVRADYTSGFSPVY